MFLYFGHFILKQNIFSENPSFNKYNSVLYNCVVKNKLRSSFKSRFELSKCNEIYLISDITKGIFIVVNETKTQSNI